SGLKGNVEAVSIIDDADRIAFWLEQFEHYWSAPDTENITAALIAALEAWLNLRPPFDIYLKTLLALGPGKEVQPPSANYKMPVKYQQVVIERLIRQLQTYRGAMLVASTGLGKTVIAIHAAYR